MASTTRLIKRGGRPLVGRHRHVSVSRLGPISKATSKIFRITAIVAVIAFAPVALSPAFAGNGSVVYTYDALGRVTTASYDTGIIIIYTYDANGNRLSQVINANANPLCMGTSSHGNPTTFGVGLFSTYATGC